MKKAGNAAKRAERRGPPPALVERVRRLEARMSELEGRRDDEKASSPPGAPALEAQEAEAKAAHKRKKRELEAELETARAAVRAEGG
jgi:hypothetical protein